MKKILFFILLASGIYNYLPAQSIGIGTTTPNNSAVVDVSSTNKGFLFPRMSLQQRLSISNPANGLHVFNTTFHSLEFYDSSAKTWRTYSNDVYRAEISQSQYQFSVPPGLQNAVYIITVDSGVVCGIAVDQVKDNSTVFIINYGYLVGSGGDGGKGGNNPNIPATGFYCNNLSNGQNGAAGGHAVVAKKKVNITIYNYALVAGGGGGGGGGSYGAGQNSVGGGGGSGEGGINPISLNCQGFTFLTDLSATCLGGIQGYKGVNILPVSVFPFGCGNEQSNNATDGTAGSFNVSGLGGSGSTFPLSNLNGKNGGSGGAWGQLGTNGGGITNGLGGAAGKAIYIAIPDGTTTNTIINMNSGVYYGSIDH